MFLVRGPWLPGFTDPPLNNKAKADHLTARHYDDATGGPALFTALRNGLVGNVNIIADCFDANNNFTYDIKNRILASCVRRNCMSAVWWMVEREDSPKWTVYAGAWDETYGLLILETSAWGSPMDHGKEIPLVVISDQPEQMKMLLDLGIV